MPELKGFKGDKAIIEYSNARRFEPVKVPGEPIRLVPRSAAYSELCSDEDLQAKISKATKHETVTFFEGARKHLAIHNTSNDLTHPVVATRSTPSADIVNAPGFSIN